MKRLDRVAGEINAWLLVIAIGFGVLDVAIMLALSRRRRKPPPKPTAPRIKSAAVRHSPVRT